MQIYSDPSRASDPHSLPDVELYYAGPDDFQEEGWYWWSCFPGCLPDGDAIGPFATEAEALEDAQSQD